MIVAGEISGDLYGSNLIENIKKSMGDIYMFGTGGPKMEKAGLKLICDTSCWGTIGLVEALKKTPKIYIYYRKLIKLMVEEKPDVLVLIDYPGLNMRLARFAKNINIPVVYYFPPSKFAKDSKDVADAAATIDYVAAPFISTAKIYEGAGANVEFVGNPLVDIVKPTKTSEELIKEFGFEGKKIISILPGSRMREIDYLLPILLDSVKSLRSKLENTEFVMPITSSVFQRNGLNKNFFENYVKKSGIPVKIFYDRTYDLLSISQTAIITSGTATLEAACLNCPMVIVYKVSKITELIARYFSNLPDYIGMPNLILSKNSIKELIQNDVTPEIITKETLKIINSEEEYLRIKEDLKRVVRLLGKTGAGLKVAEKIKEMMDNN